MAATSRIHSVINAWETVRYELMNTRICNLPLRIERSPVEPYVQRLRNEFAANRFSFDFTSGISGHPPTSPGVLMIPPV